MTDLTRRALATTPLSYETVEDFFDGSASGSTKECLRELCISHERLRWDLEGAEILIAEDDERNKDTHNLLIEMRKYIVHHGLLIGECVAWNKLKEIYSVCYDRLDK